MKRKCLIFLSVLLLLTMVPRSEARQTAQGPQVILLFFEGMSFTDLERWRTYPHVDRWLEQAGIGALSVRPPGTRTAANAYLLMGSGSQALYTERSGTAYEREEMIQGNQPAGAWATKLGLDPAGSQIVFPGIFRLHAENRDKPYTSQIGLLGSTLAAHQIPVTAYGSGDYGDVRQRHAILFAMDELGRVPHGDLHVGTTSSTEDYPHGIRTHYEELLSRIAANQDQGAGLITVQLSDLARLYQLADAMEANQFERSYDRIMQDWSAFLDRLLSARTENQTVMVVSPAVHTQASQEKKPLPPILVWRNTESGLLTSATTRQPGLVSGLDILPTLLSWLQVPQPKGLAGHTLRIQGSGTDIASFFQKVEGIHHTYATRSSVLYTYVMLQMITLAGAVALWLWGRKRGTGEGGEKLRRGMRLALLAMLWFPFLLLVEAALTWQVSGIVVLGALIMTSLLLAFLMEVLPLSRTVAIVCGLTVGGLLLDGWTGATLMRQSYLGYDPVIGARFYGLGNEYEGVLIGSTVLLVAALYQLDRTRDKRQGWGRHVIPVISAVLFVIVLYYMVAPHLGTDAGGFLAGLIGFFVAGSRLSGWRLGKKGLLLLAGGLLSGVLVLIAGSLLTDQPLTHVGRVSQQIVSGDWAQVAQMLERKLEMNIRLIRVSIWSKVFVVSLLVLGVLSLRNDRFLGHLAQDYPYLVKGFAGVIAGSLAGLVLNDSGIVTAATCIMFMVVPTLYAALGAPTESAMQTEGANSREVGD